MDVLFLLIVCINTSYLKCGVFYHVCTIYYQIRYKIFCFVFVIIPITIAVNNDNLGYSHVKKSSH